MKKYRVGRRTDGGEMYIDRHAMNTLERDHEYSASAPCASEPSWCKPALKPYPEIADQAEYEAKYWQRAIFASAWREAVRAYRIEKYR